MNISTTQAKRFRARVGKIAIVVAVALAIGDLGITPAFAEEHDNRVHNRAPARHYSQPASHHAYHHAQPFYAPAPVYYAPQPSPGISLFIPINIR
jgi:hypothetical protein